MSEKERYLELYKRYEEYGTLVDVGQLLKKAKDNWPDNLVVICDGQKITYKELYQKANALAKILNSMKVNPYDKVILIYENSTDFYIAYFAVWHSGAIIVPLNIFLSENEVTKIINEVQPKVIIISDKFKKKFKHIENLNITIVEEKTIKELKPETKFSEPEKRTAKDTVAILYTSGTTGMAKGVMLNSENIIINTIQAASRFEASQNDRIFCPLPLFHSFPQNTCLWLNVVLGTTAIILSKIERATIIEGLKHKPTVIIAIPAIYGLFCKMRNLKFGKIRYYFSGGDILSDKIRKYFELLYGRQLCNGYGLTETSPFISVDIDDYLKPTNNIGNPFFGIEVQIRDYNEKELAKGEIGTLWLKGPNIMQGYFNDPDATAKVIKNGWFNTGDLGYIDDTDKIVITGREKDVIKSKGMHIYPHEIENLLLTNNKVILAAVISITGSDGEYPIAIISSLEKDKESLKKELFELCRQNLAEYKIPKKIIIQKDLPLTATGKIDKKKLKQDFAE